MLLLSNFSKIAVVQRNLSNSSKSAFADEKLPPKKFSILLPQDAPAGAYVYNMWATPNLLVEGRSKSKHRSKDPPLWNQIWEDAEEQQRFRGASGAFGARGIAGNTLQLALTLFSFSKADLSCTKFSDIAVNLLMSKEAVDQIRQLK